MTIVRLVYYSRASKEMSLADLKNILNTARDNNGSMDICGMLCYDQQYFLQTLEGEREAVNELYLDIADDARHDEVTIISYEEIDAPLFSQWQMGYSASAAEFTALLSELGQSSFLPNEMTADQAFTFLKGMSAQQSEL